MPSLAVLRDPEVLDEAPGRAPATDAGERSPAGQARQPTVPGTTRDHEEGAVSEAIRRCRPVEPDHHCAVPPAEPAVAGVVGDERLRSVWVDGRQDLIT